MIRVISGIVFLILITTVVVVINPELHKPVSISGSSFVLENTNTTSSGNNIEVVNKENVVDNSKTKLKNIDNFETQKSQNISSVEQIKNLDNILTTNSDADARLEKLIKMQEQQRKERVSARKDAEKVQQEAEARLKKAQQTNKSVQKNKTTPTSKPAEKKVEQTVKKSIENKTVTQQPVTNKPTQPKASTPKEEASSKVQQPKSEAQKPSTSQKKLTEYEETVIWGQWRANVANAVASKVSRQNSSIPVGTIYSYSFDVDSRHCITNISVRISRGNVNAITHQGIFMIQQAIKSLNLSTILEFPPNTQRTTVKVSGAIEMSGSRFSNTLNSKDFNDVEKIKKQRYE